MTCNPKKTSHHIETKLALLLTSFLFVFSAFASNEHVKDVEIFNCTEGFCVKLNAKHLYKSSLGNHYAFSNSDVEIQFDGDLKKKTFKNFEGSFDPKHGRFYLSKKDTPLDYMIDSKNKTVDSFKAQN
ncbi:MAG: hypothetical protein HRT44_00580 [Bdellovibrionales bacterium]|nr:hypothetical protein [Bdellovibrionales bacterium]NQZ17746.1 hypothetical protein [Bdellovibrionales bacterium]